MGCRLPGDLQGPWCSLHLLSTNQQNLPLRRLTHHTLFLPLVAAGIDMLEVLDKVSEQQLGMLTVLCYE